MDPRQFFIAFINSTEFDQALLAFGERWKDMVEVGPPADPVALDLRAQVGNTDGPSVGPSGSATVERTPLPPKPTDTERSVDAAFDAIRDVPVDIERPDDEAPAILAGTEAFASAEQRANATEKPYVPIYRSAVRRDSTERIGWVWHNQALVVLEGPNSADSYRVSATNVHGEVVDGWMPARFLSTLPSTAEIDVDKSNPPRK